MPPACWPAKERILAVLLAAALAAGARPGLAQETSASQTPIPAPAASPPNDEGGAGGPALPAPAPAARGQAKAESTGAPDKAGNCKSTGWDPSRWSKVPVIRPTPRTGWFLLPPSGPGYYSAGDRVRGAYRSDPPVYPYGNPSYEHNFHYLDKPDGVPHDYADFLKRVHPGDDWMLLFGGEERIRPVNEVSSRLSVRDNNFDLLRSRVYGDLWFRDRLRLFTEYFDAQSYNQDLPPLRTDVDRSDFFNLFVDVKLFDLGLGGEKGPVYFRGGQQELLYGSQRLVSPPDWSNTRRTFRGIKGFYRGERWDADAFWVRPVIPDPSHLDATDHNQEFAGCWLTHRPRKGQALDFYYLFRDQQLPRVTGRDKVQGAYDVNTFGGRCAGDSHNVLWDFEGMYQFGTWANQAVSAGAVTTGLGYRFANLPFDPHLWLYNDFASGDQNPGKSGTHTAFNQLFPSGHTYFGFLDLVGRQNIDDLNMQFSVRPAKWVTSLVQVHFFYLDSAKDALYNAQGTAIRQDPSGKAGHHVGDEIDWLTIFRLSLHQEFQIGYSKLFDGEFIRRTGPAVSPELFYVQYYYRW